MYIYSSEERRRDPYALPDIEVIQEDTMKCETCGAVFPDPNTNPIPCPECGARVRAACIARQQWYWQPCFPGCLPDGELTGPYPTFEAAEADAIDFMRSELD